MPRVFSPMLDSMIDKETKIPVLDKGFVQVIDYMGTDASIVQAARVSYGKGTKTRSEDEHLIRYLLRNWHTTPFEMCRIKLLIKCPMDAWRQWIRHRTASVNEYSTRYSEAIDDKQCTQPDQWRYQSNSNKQGSGDFLTEDVGVMLSEAETHFHDEAEKLYRDRLDRGVAREQARKDLPLSTYTIAYWSMDLHNLLHFLRLRMDSHAQKEIREFATVIGEQVVAEWVPAAWQAFKDYRLEATQLTALDTAMLRAIVKGNYKEIGMSVGWFDSSGKPKQNSRELNEFEVKAIHIGVQVPWHEVPR